MAINLNTLTNNTSILCLGYHPNIIQSVLDFDAMLKTPPSIKAIISSRSAFGKFFYQDKEILIPFYSSIADLPDKTQPYHLLNLTSARTAPQTTLEAVNLLPNLKTVVIFAEGITERNSLRLLQALKAKNILGLGPSSVGFLYQDRLKLGPIGGTMPPQIHRLTHIVGGSTAVISCSGGMTNEMINLLYHHQKGLSFGLALGGDRFPFTSPLDAFLIAEQDTNTSHIIYYGELGGQDEYQLVKARQNGTITKPAIIHIAGTVSDLFPTPPQFGHAKAKAGNKQESAAAKRQALQQAGFTVSHSWDDFISLIKRHLPTKPVKITQMPDAYRHRQPTHFTTTITAENQDQTLILGKKITDLPAHSLGFLIGSLFLGRPLKSPDTADFIELIIKLTLDHGPAVAGAHNTIVAARAGKDLVSSLASGLLTIGSRFGGATNQAARFFYQAFLDHLSAIDFVNQMKKQNLLIPGIGHRKYRIDIPDPRVKLILKNIKKLKKHPLTDFALQVQDITAQKKPNLILNVDGAIAVGLIDFLTQKEKLGPQKIQKLIQSEFFNAFFVLARSTGLIAHFLDQKRLNEPLYRHPIKDILFTSKE
ncbi:MAG: ATP citrate synthase [bacterium]|nr:ATP citrate synthase [bacterium]